jgi:hypothetical protein
MMGLPDGAIRDVKAEDFEECMVVRVGDEFVVDLMRQACGIDFSQAGREIVVHEVGGVPIPFANPKLLWRTKQTRREKHALDVAFLVALLKERGEWR